MAPGEALRAWGSAITNEILSLRSRRQRIYNARSSLSPALQAQTFLMRFAPASRGASTLRRLLRSLDVTNIRPHFPFEFSPGHKTYRGSKSH